MVIDKILKVNSQPDERTQQLRERLAALQKNEQPQASVQQNTQSQNPAQVQPTQKQPERPLDRSIAAIQDPRLAAATINPELKLREERTTNLIMNQIKELITLHTEASKRLKDTEGKQGLLEKEIEGIKDRHEELLQKMNTIDSRLEKFMGLYELVTNQYNPFAEASQAAPQPTAPQSSSQQRFMSQPPTAQPASKPQLSSQKDFVVQVEDSITKQTASVPVVGADQTKAQERFKRVEELLADLQKKHEEQHVAETPKPVQQEMHGMFENFEGRLQRYIDKALSTQLHEHFSKLESTMQQEVRDALKEEISSVQQDDRNVQEAFSEIQAMLQSGEGQNRGAVESELSELSAEISKLRDDVKSIPPNLYFRVADGMVVRDLQELRLAFKQMSDQTFSSHVGSSRNDFADWVEHALLLPNLAKQLRDARTQQDMLQVLQPTI